MSQVSAAESTLLSGRVACVTEAASPVGRSVVGYLASAGATVCAIDIDGDELMTLVADLRGAGRSVIGAAADVSDAFGVDEVFAYIADQWGGVDVLVNVAVGGTGVSFSELDAFTWQRLFDASAGAMFATVRCARRTLEASQRGVVVNVIDESGVFGEARTAASGRAAAVHLSRALGHELAEFGIGVYGVLCKGDDGAVVAERVGACVAGTAAVERGSIVRCEGGHWLEVERTEGFA